MTTVACDGRSMSADGRACVHSARVSESGVKLFKSWDGRRLIGTSGEACSTARYARWLARPRLLRGLRPSLSNGNVIELLPDGRLLSHQHDGTPLAVDLPYAIGSGADFAIGAMMAGASAEQAVDIAAKRDVFTGGKVVTLLASCDTQPKAGDVQQAPLVSGAVGEAETPKA